MQLSATQIYLSESTSADNFERLEIFDAKSGTFQTKKFSFFLSMLQPLLLLLLFRQTLVFQRFL